ncbi:pleckstrin homology domain-containing family A member 6 isoform X3 [Syngnathus typhle]|uniref:pleckstrin homology domain-containing family A member 6 isoform X3 n=4 Tax=Syngnathus typhle TaxID=161592 RepID=UPI002A6A9318|nr:pleckstrin homology domain-containing family A member 6 isoform X3 [Syngnathus typhle]XP_061146422.1 pleckstrin homology domain-containing family A member 6 isoform X3 [Syngnathus typhle]
MLKFRVDKRVSQHDGSRTAGSAMNVLQLQEPAAIHTNLQSCDLTMKGKVNTGAEKVNHTKSTNMVSQEVPPCARTSRTPRKAATFGKRSNSMRRNPKAEVHKAGWLYKQASSGVKQWNKRWFVLSDRCLFYYKDEKEDAVLGSLPLLSFRIGGVQPSDNITRKFAFKVWLEEGGGEEEEEENGELKAPVVFCVQAEHAGTRTYYFSTDSYEEQKEWIAAMSEAAEVNVNPSQRSNTAVTPERTMVTRDSEPQIEVKQQITANDNGLDNLETPPLSTSCSDQSAVNNSARQEDCGGKTEDEGGGPACGHAPSIPNPNGWTNHFPAPQNHKSKAPRAQNHSTATPQRQAGGGVQPPDDTREQHPNVVLRRGFVPRTGPERVAQRKSSMAQLQHWVNQRRVMVSQEDINSPSHYYPANQGFDYYGYPSGGPQYLEEYPLYPPGVRPDSICSAAGAYDHRWAVEDKRRSLRDGPHQVYPRDSWGPQSYGGVDVKSLRRLSIQPRSRSVPRSPSLSSGGAYSPAAHNFASPARSASARFDRFSGRMRDDGIYADPSAYNLRRSLSSPKYDYSGDRRSINQGLYQHHHHHHHHHNYPVSPSIHNKMVPPFHDVYRELHPTLKLNEIETSKLLGRLCEQNHIVKDHEAVVHRLRMDKDSLEEALVATHQEMEKYQSQPVAMEKLHIKKETLQKQLINIRGELSQASNALTTTRMEFEALEDEAHAIHGDLWEQLNAGIQSELVRRHIQKEFWRVQDVLEGLHKNHSSRGTDTAKHKVASGASGSFSTNSPASPLSSVSLSSPLGPYSPVPGSQVSPSKQLGPEITFGGQNNMSEPQNQGLERRSTVNKGVPSRTKSPADASPSWSAGLSRQNGRMANGISRERPKSAVFPADLRSKMSVEEQNERIRRNQSSSVRDKRRSLNLSSVQSPAGYKVIRRRLTAHEIDINDLEAAVRGQGLESPREEIARLRRSQVEPEHYDLDINRELMAPEKVIIPERYLEMEDNSPLSPEEQKEKQKKLERIKTLIAKSNLQNVVPALDGPVEGGAPVNSQQQLQEQEKRIEISCALAAEASRRSRLLSAQCAPDPPTSPTSLHSPPSSADFPTSSL